MSTTNNPQALSNTPQSASNTPIEARDFLDAGMLLHGHKCPAMPLGLRAGAAALNALGVERAKDGELVAFVEVGRGHFATCYVDGVMMVTGCTAGKGNLHRTHMGKWGLTLIDAKTSRAVRVTPKAALFEASMQSPFFVEYRSQGIPASKVPAKVVDPMVERMLSRPDAELFDIGEVFEYVWKEPKHSFSGFVCEECGEMTVEPYGRLVAGARLCIPCSEARSGFSEPLASGGERC